MIITGNEVNYRAVHGCTGWGLLIIISVSFLLSFPFAVPATAVIAVCNVRCAALIAVGIIHKRTIESILMCDQSYLLFGMIGSNAFTQNKRNRKIGAAMTCSNIIILLFRIKLADPVGKYVCFGAQCFGIRHACTHKTDK